MPIILDGTAGITTPMYGGSIAANAVTPVTAFKNRIINGAMVIDQRNAGGILTVNSTAQKYPVDRFYCENSTSGVFTIQQSSTAPAGFNNSVVATVTSGSGTLTGTQYAAIAHQIEGYNSADMNFGTANAKTFTLSFWVQSSVTGTFGGTFRNSADNRCYPFTYVINSANTWEQKSITVAGDTSGTWVGATNGIGLKVWFSLGTGPTYSGTANAWTSTLYVSATGATNLLATNGATWYITGVQLEVGSTATSFDYRPYGTELALCQRYYQRYQSLSGLASQTNTFTSVFNFIQEMRSSPTVGTTAVIIATDTYSADFTQSSASASIAGSRNSVRGAQIDMGNFSGMTQGRTLVQRVDTSGLITLSAEL